MSVAPLALAPPPAPARPRVLLVGTALASAASFMLFAGLIAVYIAKRTQTVAATGAWLPQGVTVPLTPGTMGLIIMTMAAVVVQWAVYAIGNDDRTSTYVAVGVTLLLGASYLVEMGYYFTQIAIPVRDPSGVGVLLFTIVGAHLAMVGAAMVFVVVMGFRTLGGQYSARDREGVAAAALFWYTTLAVYAVIWYSVFVIK